MRMRSTPARAGLVLAVCVAALAACAGERPAAPAWTAVAAEPVNPVPAGYHGRFRVAATVLGSPAHGPQLCQAVAESYPPQCAGPDLPGWSWAGLAHQSASGTRWGHYLLIGTFDGKRLTLTEPAKIADPAATPPATPHLTSPCHEPSGGWRPVDPDKAGQGALETAIALASTSADFAGAWIDAENSVLNVRYTGDPATHEAELRRVWGGALCLLPARRTEADLRAVQEELIREPGVHSSGVDVAANRVDVGVWVADVTRQADLDNRYGPGVVRLVGFLEPLDR